MHNRLRTIFTYINDNRHDFVDKLKEDVEILTVSTDDTYRRALINFMKVISERFISLGALIENVNLGYEKYPDDSKCHLPPVILASFGDDIRKTTLLVYLHADVCDVNGDLIFQVPEEKRNVVGRGSADSKGSLTAWFACIESFQKTNIKLPVNLKFVVEGMAEAGSQEFAELLCVEREDFFKDVEYVCTSNGYWIDTEKPSICYGARSIAYFFVHLHNGSERHLHSGVHGGALTEPMNDCVRLMDSMFDKEGNVCVTDFYEDVADLNSDTEQLYKNIAFDTNKYASELNVHGTKTLDGVSLLKDRWHYPCISLHGIEKALNDPGVKAWIPHEVIGKFSVRIVPNQSASTVCRHIKSFLVENFAQFKSTCTLEVNYYSGGPPWLADPFTRYYEAGRRATKRIWKVEPDFIREGASLPILVMFKNTLEKEILILPIFPYQCNPHEPTEYISKRHFVQGIKLFAAFLYEVADIELEYRPISYH